MPDSYQPGQRRAVYGKNHQISESRYAWIQCESGKFVILVGKDEGHGSDVVIHHPKPGKMPDVNISLTNLTAPELVALRDLLNTALEWAEPVVERRDKEAADAWNAGDDSHTRNYRPLPTVVYRKRPQPEHGEGVRIGPEDVSSSVPIGRDDDRVRGAGGSVAEHDARPGQPEDDSTSPDDLEGVRQVDGSDESA